MTSHYISKLYDEVADFDDAASPLALADFATYRCQQAEAFIKSYERLTASNHLELSRVSPSSADSREKILKGLNYLEISINDYNSSSQSWELLSTHFTLTLPANGAFLGATFQTQRPTRLRF
jgi:hypothetical protein